jgi:hypothetical protein
MDRASGTMTIGSPSLEPIMLEDVEVEVMAAEPLPR